MTTSTRLKKKRAIKKRRPKSHNNNADIKSLPRDLLVEVVATVASHSFIDLNNMKKCCRDFLDATEDRFVWKRVSLDNFPLIQWFPNEKASSFLKRCRESENLESLYREGLQEYFSYPNGYIIGGLESLKMAAQKGHKEAKYVYGMILLCSQDNEMRKEGLEYMRFLRKAKCIINCRKKVGQLMVLMWRNNNGMVVRNKTCLCNNKSSCKGWRLKKGIWSFLDDDDDDISSSCEYCRWDHELEYFYQLFNVH
ncbi:F-box-like domain superfamily [Sesbania bispinosa]|nr:F-box-like domain superfamily [Sesbania bispinosa]